jgi:hypothetical protein
MDFFTLVGEWEPTVNARGLLSLSTELLVKGWRHPES